LLFVEDGRSATDDVATGRCPVACNGKSLHHKLTGQAVRLRCSACEPMATEQNTNLLSVTSNMIRSPLNAETQQLQ
jgi:hypothetical protein